MPTSLMISIELLANHPHLIPVIGEIRWAVHFYQKCGWEMAEIINRSPEETISVLTKSLRA